MNKTRCSWVNPENQLYVKYHDSEWGVPVHDDRKLFEMICLEGAQAGLSWETILKKREGYRKAFVDFDPAQLAKFSDQKLEKLMLDPGIVRNRLKIWSVRTNARAFLKIQAEYGSFEQYLWAFTKGKPIVNRFETGALLPARTSLSDQISKELKKRGFKFVGTTICYAFLQAVGVVNDHSVSCFRSKKSKSR